MIQTRNQGNILIVDSDENIVRLLRYNFKTEGFNVASFNDASEVKASDLSDVRLVIVDAMEQKFTGLDLIIKLKNNPQTNYVPIIMCTEPLCENLVIDSFDRGADDFIVKPFSLRELLARVNALLRRYPKIAPTQNRINTADVIYIQRLNVRIDTTNRRVMKAGKLITLTKTEFAILDFLIKNNNQFFTRDQIYNEVWREDATSSARIVDTNISRLRKKLGEASKIIVNRYGLGYAFSDNSI